LDDPRFRLSSFAVVLPLGGDRAFVGHAIYGRPLVCEGAVGRVLQSLGSPQTLSELERSLEHDELFAESLASVVSIVGDLRARGIVTTDVTELEATEARRWVEDHLVPREERQVREQMRAELAPAERLVGAPAERRRSAVVLGWCAAEALVPALREQARARGVELDVVTGFEQDAELARTHDADFTLLALANIRLLTPLFACDSSEGFAAALAHALSECERSIRAAAAYSRGTLLVQGCVTPQTEPLGLVGPLSDISFCDRIVELNRGIRRVVGTLAGAVYLDLDRLSAGAGKARLLDDLVAPWAHAGVAGGASNREFHRLVARACFDALDASAGRDTIRCIAVDLDGLLWPGELADPEFSFEDEQRVTSLLYGVHGGIHEALRALRARGIVLAVVSKNVRDSVLDKWRDAAAGVLGSASHLLGPDDFVALKIGWHEKSQSIRELSHELGIACSAIAFVDDTPLERAEVRHTLPEVWVLDCPVDRVRETLLTSPRFELLERSPEARSRADATRARVLRDGALARAGDRAAFLDSLEVRCTLSELREPRQLDRVTELLARTNQFRTTAERPSRREIEALARAEDGSILTMAVSDRFGSYGVAGVALISGAELRLFALSCRVIGADVHLVLFRVALERCRAAANGGDLLVRFAETPHNAPARRLFEGAEWRALTGGYVLSASSPLPRAPTHAKLTRA
jgi:FkbH-like protein